MMTEQEYILTVLCEELGEVQKEILKCLRFGIHNDSHESVTNFSRVVQEWSDVIGLVELLKEEGLVLEAVDTLKKRRKDRYAHYRKFSVRAGIIEDRK